MSAVKIRGNSIGATGGYVVLALAMVLPGCTGAGMRGIGYPSGPPASKVEMPLVEIELPKEPAEYEPEPEPLPPPIRDVILGTSVKGSEIAMSVFGEADAPSIFIFGGIHGEEGTAAATARRLVEYLWDHPEYYRDRRVAVLPRANPDGLAANRRVNEHGVDLNRNFPAHNFKASPRHGTHPASEPETRAIIRAVNVLEPTRIISIHSCRRGRHGNNWDGPAEEIAKAMSRCNKYRQFGTWHNPTPGSFGNWAGIDRQIPTITLELPNDLSADRCWRDNRDAILEFIRTPPVGK